MILGGGGNLINCIMLVSLAGFFFARKGIKNLIRAAISAVSKRAASKTMQAVKPTVMFVEY